MDISILHWLGFEFLDIRCEAHPNGTALEQTEDVLDQCRSVLAHFGLSFEDNVRSRIWAVDRESWAVANDARFAALSGQARGASSSYIAPGHFRTGASVGLDLLAVRPRPGIEKVITDFTDRTARPICYVMLGPLLVLSGMTAVLPTLEAQVTTDVLPRITGYLADAGSSWDRAAKVSCYLHRSMNSEEMIALFRRTVPVSPPLFEIVFVDGYSQEGKLVEIEVTAERKA